MDNVLFSESDIRDLARTLHRLAEGHDEIDVRLRYFRKDWYVYSGDASYDQDHRGYWAASAVSQTDSWDTLVQIARQMFEECTDDALTYGEEGRE